MSEGGKRGEQIKGTEWKRKKRRNKVKERKWMPEGRQQRRNSSDEKEEKESEGMNKGEKRI